MPFICVKNFLLDVIMPNYIRKTFKHLIIYDKDNTTKLTDVYLSKYEDVHAYIVKNFPAYDCPVSILKAIVNKIHISSKYDSIVPFIKLNLVLKQDIPKYSIIINNYH